jgi:hypothetical protein
VTLGAPMELSAHNRKLITYRNERLRAVSTGIWETAGQTFLLLIAVRFYDAGATAKAAIAAGNSVGLILTLLVVSVVAARGWNPSHAAGWLSLIATGCMVWAAAMPELPVFIVCSVIALACVTMAVPLYTQIYQDNYPATERGRLFSRTTMIRIGVAVGCSYLFGAALSGDHLRRFPLLLLIYAAALAGGAYWISQCPSQPLTQAGGTHPWRAFRFVKEDRVFRLALICWMLMGFANLMMMPLRVEYLANPAYGLKLETTTVALIVGVIPNIARLVMSPVWGWVFDRMNFFALRVVLNVGFAVSILAFFTSNSMAGLVTGAVLFGISNAGGDVAWSLWVTKFAPPDRVADYMSMHTFLTGLRGLVAPFAAFYLLGVLSVATLGWMCAGLIVIASLILVREIMTGKSPDVGTELVKEGAK